MPGWTWKEGTPFKKDPTLAIDARIEPAATDDRRRAIQYILLHELGHVIAAAGKLGPSWELSGVENRDHDPIPVFAHLLVVIREEETYFTRFPTR